ncbi:MAG TPA: NUDIX hydrolase [Candidatus Saccharimonadales bacterium]
MQDTPCTYRVSTKAIIKDEAGKILLLQESNGQWDLPGGGLDQGEKPHDAIAREVIEETGYAVTQVSEEPVAFWTVTRPGSPTIKWFAFVAYDVLVTGDFKPAENTNDAAVAWKFVSSGEAGSMTLHPNARGYFETVKR